MRTGDLITFEGVERLVIWGIDTPNLVLAPLDEPFCTYYAALVAANK